MDFPVKHGDILLEKYRVERILGRGGMGFVVAARHVDLDELFAFKVLLPEAAARPDAAERFLREARAAVKLKGEHVVRVHDVGRLPCNTPYILMEHLEGMDLRGVLQQNGPLPVPEAVSYVLQACQTLREAHAIGIVHRDVKPANLFLTRRPDGSACVKILDFGISKLPQGAAVSLTGTMDVGGSPVYMSPEQMRSVKCVDHRTDVWSVGIVLYELMTGVTPFRAETITAVAGRVLQEEAEPPSRHNPGIPAAFDAVVLRCLAKPPEDRFQSIDDLTAALQTALAGERPFARGTTVRMNNPSKPATATLQLPVKLAVDSFAPAPPPLAPVAAGPPPPSSRSLPAATTAFPPSAGVATTTSGIGHSSRPAQPRPQRTAFIAVSLGALCFFIGVVAMTVWRWQATSGEAAAGTPEIAPAPASEPATPIEPTSATSEPASPKIEPASAEPAAEPSAAPTAPEVLEPAPPASVSASTPARPPATTTPRPGKLPPKKRTMH